MPGAVARCRGRVQARGLPARNGRRPGGCTRRRHVVDCGRPGRAHRSRGAGAHRQPTRREPGTELVTSEDRMAFVLIAIVNVMMIVNATSAFVAQTPSSASSAQYTTTEISFRSQDGQELFGKLTMPSGTGRRPVVMMLQTAEAQAVDSRVQGPRGPIDFFDLYRKELAAMEVA